MSNRNAYAKAMKSAYTATKKKGDLGVGFGGEAPKKATPIVKAIKKMK